MNPSSAPANNETVAYGQLLAQSSKLKRADQVNLVRALAGQLGMIAVFPNQLVQQAVSPSGGQKTAKAKGPKGPAKREPTNPLSGTPEKKDFDAAKKAVAKATKEAGGQKLAPSDPLVLALESAKDKYFRTLSSAKGKNSAPASSWADETAAQAAEAGPAPKEKEPAPKPPSPKAKEVATKKR